jgi:hypothetical protein
MTGNNLLINFSLLAFPGRDLVLGSCKGTDMVQHDRRQVATLIVGIAIALVLCAILFLTFFLFFSPTLPFME